MRTTDRVLQHLRELCLSLPETSEVGSWGHPNFRAGKRTFATFERVDGRPSIAFRLNTTSVGLLLRRKQFFVTPYGLGQWVSVWADAPLNWRYVAHLLRRSYRVVALKRMISVLDKTSRKSRMGRAGYAPHGADASLNRWRAAHAGTSLNIPGFAADFADRSCFVGKGSLIRRQRITRHYAVTGDLRCLVGDTAASCAAPGTEHCWPNDRFSRIDAPGTMPWDSKTAGPVDEADRCQRICHITPIQNSR